MLVRVCMCVWCVCVCVSVCVCVYVGGGRGRGGGGGDVCDGEEGDNACVELLFSSSQPKRNKKKIPSSSSRQIRFIFSPLRGIRSSQ